MTAEPVKVATPALTQAFGEVADRPQRPTEDASKADDSIATMQAAMDKLSGKPEDPEKEDPEYSKEDVEQLLDSLIHNGFAMETFNIRELEIKIRTRFDWEDKQIMRHMDIQGANLNATYQNELSRTISTGALVQVGGTFFKPVNEGTPEELTASFEARYKFVTSLNSVLAGIIERKVWEFDKKQRYVVANFDKLLEDF